VSLYQLNKIMYLLETDSAFLARMKSDPAAAIASYDLSPGERDALLGGEVGELYLMGVNAFMLDSVARHELLGQNRESYMAKVRAAAQRRDAIEKGAAYGGDR
jgi:hypothetical protein